MINIGTTNRDYSMRAIHCAFPLSSTTLSFETRRGEGGYINPPDRWRFEKGPNRARVTDGADWFHQNMQIELGYRTDLTDFGF